MNNKRWIGAALGITAAALWLGRRGHKPVRGARSPVTPSTGTRNSADAPIGPAGNNLESRLDEGLDESFPASDPVSIHIE